MPYFSRWWKKQTFEELTGCVHGDCFERDRFKNHGIASTLCIDSVEMKPVFTARLQARNLKNGTGRAGSLCVVQVDGIDVINVLFAVDLQLVIS